MNNFSLAWAVTSLTLLSGQVWARDNVLLPESFPKPMLKPGLSHAPVVDPVAKYVKDYTDALSSRIYGNWEPVDNCQQKKFRVHFFIDKYGQFQHITIVNPSESAQANFSCIEAVSESSGFRSNVPQGISEVKVTLNRAEATNTTDCAGNFLQNHADAGDKLCWHLIPLAVIQCNAEVDRPLIHTNSNLRLLNLNERNFNALEAIGTRS